MRTGIGILLTLATIAVLQPAQAQSNPGGLSNRELQDLYNLCSRFPHNPRCAGYNVPVPLEQRSGVRVSCSLAVNNPSDSNDCRVAIAEDQLRIYMEEGGPIALLNNQPATREMIIPFSAISGLNLQVWGRSTDTTSFLIGGSLYVSRARDFANLPVDFDPTTDADERSGNAFSGERDFAELQIGFITEATTPDANRSNVLEIAADEEFGIYLLQRLSPSLTASTLSVRAQLLAQEPVATGATASNATIEQLKETNTCVRCDLRGADLQGADLEDANLEGANLQGANLAEANLEDAYLVGADLSQANLSGADLSGTRLTAAVLTNANFSESRLRGTDLQNADLQMVNLQNAELSGAILERANLTSANLEGADLSDITTTRNWIPFMGLFRFRVFTNLSNANLTSANLTNAQLEDAWLRGANFSNARLTGVDLSDVDLTGSSLCGATMPNGSTSNQGC